MRGKDATSDFQPVHKITKKPMSPKSLKLILCAIATFSIISASTLPASAQDTASTAPQTESDRTTHPHEHSTDEAEYLLDVPNWSIPTEASRPDVIAKFKTTENCWRLDHEAELCQLSPWDPRSSFNDLTVAISFQDRSRPDEFAMDSIANLTGNPEAATRTPLIELLGVIRGIGATPGLQSFAMSIPDVDLVGSLLYTDISDIPSIARWRIQDILEPDCTEILSFNADNTANTNDCSVILAVNKTDQSRQHLWAIVIKAEQPSISRISELSSFLSLKANKFIRATRR